MTPLTLVQLERIAGGAVDATNARSLLRGLEAYGYPKLGLDRPHRLAMFLAQVLHESARLRYDREVWGPTAAQNRYDVRVDLGNTPERDGDGYLYRGRTPIQITGKSNYRQFTDWCRANISRDTPDFVADPDAANTDPWEGLAALWYWQSRGLNRFADVGDMHGLTRAINGGYNGLDDRLALYVRAGLVLLGYGPTEILRFQMDNDIDADGVAGPKTRAALHSRLFLAGVPARNDRPAAPAANPFAALFRAIARLLVALTGRRP